MLGRLGGLNRGRSRPRPCSCPAQCPRLKDGCRHLDPFKHRAQRARPARNRVDTPCFKFMRADELWRIDWTAIPAGPSVSPASPWHLSQSRSKAG